MADRVGSTLAQPRLSLIRSRWLIPTRMCSGPTFQLSLPLPPESGMPPESRLKAATVGCRCSRRCARNPWTGSSSGQPGSGLIARRASYWPPTGPLRGKAGCSVGGQLLLTVRTADHRCADGGLSQHIADRELSNRHLGDSASAVRSPNDYAPAPELRKWTFGQCIGGT